MRDGIKSKQMKLDDVPGQISEAYSHLIEAKTVLTEAKDEISGLQAELAKLKDFVENYELRDNVYWRKGTQSMVHIAHCVWAISKRQSHFRTKDSWAGVAGFTMYRFILTPPDNWVGTGPVLIS